jgi:hypothetical protein
MLWATPPLFRQPQLRELRLRFDIVAAAALVRLASAAAVFQQPDSSDAQKWFIAVNVKMQNAAY